MDSNGWCILRFTSENIFKILNNSVYFQNIVVCNEPLSTLNTLFLDFSLKSEHNCRITDVFKKTETKWSIISM